MPQSKKRAIIWPRLAVASATRLTNQALNLESATVWSLPVLRAKPKSACVLVIRQMDRVDNAKRRFHFLNKQSESGWQSATPAFAKAKPR